LIGGSICLFRTFSAASEKAAAARIGCPIYESAGSVKAFRWDFLGFVRPFEHTFTSG
jgi:hypothetical protein